MKHRLLLVSGVLLSSLVLGRPGLLQAQGLASSSELLAQREIAVTFDDLPLGGRQFEVERMRAMTEKLLASITRNAVPAIGFVNEGKLYRLGEQDELTALLRLWVFAGLELGNHTFSHPSLQVTPVAAYKEDVIRGETITKMLLAEADMTLRYFRHPFLRTGPSLGVRADVEGFLRERGYTVAPVTIENSDWLFAAAYADARGRGDRQTMRRVGDAYLDYTRAEFEFWEKVSVELLGYQVKHVLLLHVNELNADYFDEVVGLMRNRGYGFISLEEALSDPAYELADRYVGPAGVSWLYRWAHSKRVEISWREEPEPPDFVVELFSSTR